MFSLLTLNINFHEAKHGPWPQRRSAIADAIARVNPDLVALQAVRRDDKTASDADQARELAERLPALRHVAFFPVSNTNGARVDGLAMLSRHPLSSLEARPLTLTRGLDDVASRTVAHVTVEMPDEPLHVFNCHFSWVAAQLHDNVAEAVDFFRTFPHGRLAVGDMNTAPDAAPLETLRQDGWIDVWARLCPHDAGFTFESDRPSLRIDYIWADEWTASRAKRIEVVSAPAGAPVRLSDHNGLFATFE